MGDENNVANEVKLGEFPYPLTKGSEESRYLTWLRNHSNYMATRGFLDYLRMAGVLVRGILLNFLILLSLLLVVSLVIGHLYGPQLRSLPSLDDLPIAKLDELASRLKQPTESKYRWLENRLSVDTKAALEAYDSRPENLQVALLKDLRDLVDDKSIGNAEPFKDEKLRLDMLERQRLAGRYTGEGLWAKSKKWWSERMTALSERSRSHLWRQNRLLLEFAYPEIRKLEEAPAMNGRRSLGAGPLWETGMLPPMPVSFALTQTVLLLALLVILFSPIWVVFGEIAGHKKSTERAGSDSSVNRRDKFERIFGFLILFIFAFALFEVLPVLVDKFHQFRASPKLNWNAIFASMAGVSVAVLGGASKLLSVLGGAKKKLAMLLIGLLGLLVPLLVILYVTEFLIYHAPPQGLFGNLHLVLPIGFIVLIVIGMLVGKRSFESSEKARLSMLLVAVFVATIAAWFFLDFYRDRGVGHEWNFWFIAIGALELWFFCRLVVDVNRTSIHGLYRDRLASAYLVGLDTKGDVDIEEDVNLGEIGCHEAGSTAPYHLVNVTLNLQGSKDMSVRDRNSDFFIFSKRFIGSKRTGYCRTETLEQVHPTMSLATAMAISAAAASPNMGRGTNPAMVALMVLLNMRLGYWLPNPGFLEEQLSGRWLKRLKGERKATKKVPPGFTFQEVFEQELVDIEKRWNNVYPNPSERKQRKLHEANGKLTTTPTTEHGLVGLGFSGGGIRSATINLGIAQALHARGIFDHVDYMSTVSGGGYLGSSISTLMRGKTKSVSEVAAKLGVHMNSRKHRSEIEGVVSLDTNARGEKIVKVTSPSAPGEQREYRFSRFDPLAVQDSEAVKAGQALIERHNTLWDRFRWRVPPRALVREMMMKLDERHKWVNLSDGGHIENLAGIELLRRRCKFIIIGDGEADPELSFNGLATLIRYARIDLGIKIDIHPDAIRVDKFKNAVDEGTDNLSREHWAFGTITYPPDNGHKQEEGYLLYLKSSYTGDEDEVIKEYRYRNPSFPHQSTADQFFNENQFECYRALGQHIGEKACEELSIAHSSDLSSFEKFAEAMNVRAMVTTLAAKALLDKEKEKKVSKWGEDFGSYIEQRMSEAPTGSVSKDSSKERGRV